MKQKHYKNIVLAAIILLMPMIGWAQTPTFTSFGSSFTTLGNTLVINGTNFTGTTSVKFGETPAKFTINSSTQITATVPKLANSGTLRITNASGSVITSSISVNRQSTSNVYTIVSQTFSSDIGDNSTPAFIDSDFDGSHDMVVGERNGNLNRYEQNATNSTTLDFRTGTINSIDIGDNSAPTFTDIDGDGLLDMLIGKVDGRISHYEQSAANSIEYNLITATFNSTTDVGSNSAPTFTDLDGDGLLDLIIGESDGNLNYYEQSAANSTTFNLVIQNFNTIDVGSNSAPTFTDLDGDGLLDMIVGERDGNLNHYEQNSANSTSFTLVTASFNSFDVGNNSAPAFTDLDDDGLLDMIIGEEAGNLNFYEQNQSPIISSLSVNPACIGATVSITGTALTGATLVTLNGTTVGTLSGITATNITFTVPAGATSGNVVVTNPNGTNIAFAMTINALPTTPTITGATAICAGGSTALTTTRTLGTNEAYLWSNGATTQNTNVSTAGTYTLSIRNTATGCTSAASTGITVTVTSPTTPTITGGTSICTGGNTTLTTTATLGTNEAYLWSNGATTQSTNVSTAGTYSLRIRNTVTGCTSAVSNTITTVVNTIPTTPTIAGATSICSGSSTTLTTTRTLGTNEAYLWSDNSSANTLSVSAAGTYSLRVRNTATGCTSAASNNITVTVNTLPNTPSVLGPNSICVGSTPTLTSITTLGTNEQFLWSDNSSASTLSIPTAGTYSCRIRNTVTGCTSGATTITVNALPTTPTIAGATVICSGSSTTLTTTRTLGTNEAFLWSDNSSASTLSVSAAGTYSLRIRNTFTNCTSAVSNAITVTVNTTPTTPTITGGTSNCSGSSTTLSTTRTLGTNEAYLWSNGATTQNTNVSAAGTYSLRIRNTATGCTSAASNSIIVTTNTAPGSPDIFPLSGTTVCLGTTVILGTLAGILGDEERLWSTGETGFTINPTVSGSYTLRMRNTVTGCTSAPSAPINVVINPIPTTPTIAGATSICSGSSTTLTTTRTLGTNEAFLWSNNSSASTLSVSAAGTYSLRIRNTVTGCTSAASTGITVAVNALPTTPTITGATSICSGSSTTLTTTRTLLTNEAYLWSDNSSANTLTVTTAGTYSLRVRNTATGCTSAASTAITVVVNSIPTAPVITGTNYFCSGGSTVLTSTITTGSYLWSNGATSRSISVNAAGDYNVRVITNGCTSAVSSNYTITSLPTGTWLGTTTDWNSGSNWCGGTPGNNTDVNITSLGLLPILSGTGSTCRNLTIAEGRTLAIASGVRLTLRGNLSGSGIIAGISGSELRIRGNANQTIPSLTIGRLIVDNNNPNLTLNLAGNVTVLNGLTLTDGVINTGSNYLILANTAANPTEIAASYISGNVRIPARTVGTGAISMLGLSIAAGTDNLDTVMIERNETAATFGSNQGINHIWKIRAGNQPISGRQVTLSWNARADNGKSLTSMQVYRRPDIGGEWIRVGGLQNGSTRSLTVTTTSFSDWTVSDAGTPLPVTWLSFTGTQTQFGNQLNWTTASELNNQGFAIERSTDGRNFTKIGFVKGNGTTNAKQHYQFTDSQLLEGYYRLQQLDFDGKTAYSTTIKVGDNVLAKALEVYPNPATDKVTVKTNGVGDLEIVNQVGKVMITQPASETNEINISRLAKGVYTVRFNGSSQKLVVR